MVKLGDKVKDRVTGFEGVATGRFDYLSGCIRVLVESDKLEAGKVITDTFDEDRLEVTVAGFISKTAESETRLGGPRDTPQRPVPTR